jgi:hypothetical protein
LGGCLETRPFRLGVHKGRLANLTTACQQLLDLNLGMSAAEAEQS